MPDNRGLHIRTSVNLPSIWVIVGLHRTSRVVQVAVIAGMLDIRCCYLFGGSSRLALLPPLPIIEHVDDCDMVTIHTGVVFSQQYAWTATFLVNVFKVEFDFLTFSSMGR